MAKGKKTGGRAKGTPNKVSGTVKDNVIAVFAAIGGTETMTKWAAENPGEFYKLYAKMLPAHIDIDATIERGEMRAEPLSDDEWLQMTQQTVQ